MAGTPELSVVCKSCGSEVSPYVTECPYCGARLRKRAPKLERVGDELEAKQRRRPRPARRMRARAPAIATERSYVTIAAILGPALLVLVQRALDRPLTELGAIAGPVDSEFWRYFAAPFVYSDLGYLFVVAVTVAVFGSALERRLGHVATLILLLACGALGMLAAEGVESLLGEVNQNTIAAGGNGIALGALAAWFAIRVRERRDHDEDAYEWIGAAVFAAVLLALPLVETWANVWAGLAGGIVGLASGLMAGALRRTA